MLIKIKPSFFLKRVMPGISLSSPPRQRTLLQQTISNLPFFKKSFPSITSGLHNFCWFGLLKDTNICHLNIVLIQGQLDVPNITVHWHVALRTIWCSSLKTHCQLMSKKKKVFCPLLECHLIPSSICILILLLKISYTHPQFSPSIHP